MKNNWRREKLEIEQVYGKWNSYEIYSKGKKFYIKDTKPHKKVGTTFLNYFELLVGTASDFLKKPLSKSSILDLGCMDGVASFAFAGQGAGKITAIEGRETNIVKARFANELLGFKNINFIQEDVRNLKYKSDSFDIVLALGILYHLDAPDLFNLIENLYKWTKGFAIIDTHIAVLPKISFTYKRRDYLGIIFKEFEQTGETNESSIVNAHSYWLTRASLLNILTRVGFTGLYECMRPGGGRFRASDDRMTIIATKGRRHISKIIKSESKNEREPFTEQILGVVNLHKANYDILKEEDYMKPK